MIKQFPLVIFLFYFPGSYSLYNYHALYDCVYLLSLPETLFTSRSNNIVNKLVLCVCVYYIAYFNKVKEFSVYLNSLVIL